MSSSCTPPGLTEIGGLQLWMSSFFLLGLLLSLTASLSVAWQYHIGTDPRLIGQHFLFLNVGFVVGSAATRALISRLSLRTLAMAGTLVATAGLVALALAAPPAEPIWRMSGLLVLGLASGTIFSAVLHVLREPCLQNAAAALARASFLFGLGCAASTVVVASTYFAGSVQLEIGFLAAVPLVFFLLFLQNRYAPGRRPYRPLREEEVTGRALRELRPIAAFLFSSLLFFQCGNEWVIAGWLALYIIQRLGASPVDATLVLAIHFGAITGARWLAPRWLTGFSQRRTVMAGLVVSAAGYVALTLATSIWVAGAAAILIAIGYAPIFPVLGETLDGRFSYHPGFYQTVFSVALTGAMSAPWLAGFIDHAWGVSYVLLLPLLGTLAVAALILLIRLEAHLMRDDGNKASAANA